MDYIYFRKKSETILRQNEKETVLQSYVPNIKGFPFAIAKNRSLPSKNTLYWIIVNRFSGKPFVIRFKTRQEAEYFFNKFCIEYDISDIDFKNPKSEFNYRIAAFDIHAKIKQEKYIKRYLGE